jgi:hypothetical protein
MRGGIRPRPRARGGRIVDGYRLELSDSDDEPRRGRARVLSRGRRRSAGCASTTLDVHPTSGVYERAGDGGLSAGALGYPYDGRAVWRCRGGEDGPLAATTRTAATGGLSRDRQRGATVTALDRDATTLYVERT